jgi:hypothetical protein
MKKFQPLVLAFCLLFGPTLAYAQLQTIVDVNRSFSGIKKVEVSGGALEVEYIGSPSAKEVSVNAFLESNNPDQDIIFVTVGDVLKITHKVTSSNWNNNRTRGHIKIKGPDNVTLDMKGGSGSVVAENVKSPETNLSVGSGSISASNIQGNVNVNAGSGSIKLSDIDGNVKGNVGSGSANFTNLKGDLAYSCGSGGVNASQIAGLVNISLTSGNAKLDDIGELGELKITSGNITANNAGLGANTSISGTSGNFRIQTPSNLRDFNYRLNATSGNITVGESRGGKSLTIDNGASKDIRGSITSGNISIVN